MEPVSSVQELVGIIVASSFDSFPVKTIFVEIKILDNRIVKGVVRSSFYKGPRGADVISITTHRIDDNPLQPYVESLVKEGKSFVVRNGKVCHASPFEWTIEES